MNDAYAHGKPHSDPCSASPLPTSLALQDVDRARHRPFASLAPPERSDDPGLKNLSDPLLGAFSPLQIPLLDNSPISP
jgi:hypothetical protein